MDLALEYSATLTIVSLSSTPPVSRLGICGTFTSFINPLNGSIPKNDISLTVFKAPFIALNGIETTLFIPAIKVLTTDLNALNIPSLIPLKILPPLENIFLHHSKHYQICF